MGNDMLMTLVILTAAAIFSLIYANDTGNGD